MEPLSEYRHWSWISWGIRQLWRPSLSASTAEDAIRQHRPVRPLPALGSSFRRLAKRRWKDMDLIIYHVSEYDVVLQRHDYFGFGVTRSTPTGWERVNNMGSEYSYSQHASGLVVALAGAASSVTPRSTVVLGVVVSPPATQVEVIFTTGEVLRDTVTNGVFLVVTDHWLQAEAAHFLGRDGNVLMHQTMS